MNFFGCPCRCGCPVAAAIVSAIIGVVAAFLQFAAVITVAPVFLWVVFGIAVAYLAGLAVVGCRCRESDICQCTALNTALLGILGAILFSVVLLLVGIVATSIVSAVLVGLTAFFFALLLTASACLVRELFGCE